MKRKSVIFLFLVFFFCAASPPFGAETLSPPWNALAENRPALDVPYVPTPEEVVNTMLDLAEVGRRDILYDLGCGDGRIVVTAAKERKVKRAVGVDLDPERIRQSNENAEAAGVTHRVRFHQKDLFDMDLREASVVSLYLLPGVNLKLRPKLLRELKPGSRIVSHDFNMGDWQPDREVQLNEHSIFYWVVPANVSGVWEWNGSNGVRQHRYRLRLRQHFQNVYRAELSVDGVETTVEKISLTGNKLQFSVAEDTYGSNGPLNFTGFVKRDMITGTVSVKSNPGIKKMRWKALRKPAQPVPIDATSADKYLVADH